MRYVVYDPESTGRQPFEEIESFDTLAEARAFALDMLPEEHLNVLDSESMIAYYFDGATWSADPHAADVIPLMNAQRAREHFGLGGREHYLRTREPSRPLEGDSYSDEMAEWFSRNRGVR